jgi:hypothetical protein
MKPSRSKDEHWQFVLDKLADRMIKARQLREKKARAGVVVVLGAGCSMQYGLPSFVDLLGYALEDMKGSENLPDPPGSEWRLESLRDRLDPDWRVAKPRELRRLLDRYLRRIPGKYCTAYLHLARLARRGYIQAVVNMNFDLLFEEAFESVAGKRPPISQTFHRKGSSEEFLVYKPHGSLRDGDGVPILDIASSELFDEQDETQAAHELFRGNDVVLLGYSGADSKIASALNPEKLPTGTQEVPPENYNQLFVFNLDHPDPRLLRIIVNRRSTELTVTDYAATFENVMEQLSEELAARERSSSGAPETGSPEASSEASSSRDFVLRSAHFSAAEAQALDECRKLANVLRSTMAVAESGHNSLEKHAETIFGLCLELAGNAGLGLTAPEKYLLYCAAYLHDLGYFWAHSGSKSDKKTGWSLLTSHGRHTAELLQKHLPEAMRPRPGTRQGLLPRTSRTASADETYPGEAVARLLIEICRDHSLDPEDRRNGSKPQQQILVGGFPIPIRMGIVQALFDAAEELSEGHPFYPSPYPLDSFPAAREDDHPEPATEQAIEDPILDLYLRRKQREIQFEYDRGRVTAWVRCGGQDRARPGESPPEGSPTAAGALLAALARDAVQDLGSVSAAPSDRGWGLVFCSVPAIPADETDLPALIKAALDERLTERVESLAKLAEERPEFQVGLVPSVLDMVAVYTDPAYVTVKSSDGKEKRLCTFDDSRGVETALAIVAEHPSPGPKPLLQRYFEIRYGGGASRGDAAETMETVFCNTFARIYYPVWRFCADNWLQGTDAVVMARASLDLGSSRYRDEVTRGLADLVEDKITFKSSTEVPDYWRAYGPKSRWDGEPAWAFGHDGCTVCTSRLLYILATARRLLPTDDLRKPFRHHDGHTLDGTVERLLRYLLSRGEDDPCWWGIEEQQRAAERDGHGDKALCSADYDAWAVRALAHVLTVDQEIREKSGNPWLGGKECGIGRSEVVQLLETRWRKLAESPAEAVQTKKTRGISLLSDRAEEPHSYILGHIGITYLTLRHLSAELRQAISLEESSWEEPVAHLREAREIFRNRRPSQLSRFYAWPAEVFLSTFETTESKRHQAEQALVGLLHDCLTSRIWIRSGEGKGSWGYNIENTQRIVSSLTTFWRAAFEDPDRFAPLIA